MALTKVINSESKQYKPVLVDKLVLDAVPTVNSLNGVTSDAVARAIAGASGDVPQVTENDNGKVLTAIYDEGGAAVEWGEAASGLPDMAGNDGKILGAVDNDGTMEAQWINKPMSNVTTSTKQFVVGVNGTGLPITVDCANASENTSTITENGSMVGSQYVYVHFDLAGLPVNNLGDATATLVVPEDVSVTEERFNLGTASVAYWKNSNNTYGTAQGSSISGTINSYRTINAGTYTISGSNPAPDQFEDGLVIMITGGGVAEDWDAFLAAVAEACTSWTLTYPSGSEVISYTIKPAVIATPGSDASGKVLTVTDTQGHYGWQPVPKELPSSTSAHAGRVLTVNSSGSPTWAVPQSATAGDGIDVTSNTVSVKAGTGLEFNDILTPGGTTNLVSQDVSETYYDTYTVYSFAPLTSGLLSQMSSGLDVTLIGEFNASVNTYAALYTLNSGSEVVNRLVLGNATGVLNPGSVVTFDTNNIKTAESNVTLSQVESNISNYRLGLLTKSGSSWSCATWNIFDDRQAITSATTATCPAMITVQDALCVSNPLPASTSADENKVLTVNASGNAVWAPAQGGGGGASYTAGDGIAIDGNNVVSADVDGTTIGIDSTTKKIKLLSTIPAAQVNSDWNAVSGVAQILNKPTIPTVDQNYNAASTNAQSGVAVAQAIAALPTPETITLGYKEF